MNIADNKRLVFESLPRDVLFRSNRGIPMGIFRLTKTFEENRHKSVTIVTGLVLTLACKPPAISQSGGQRVSVSGGKVETTGALALNEASAPSGVTQIQILVMNDANCFGSQLPSLVAPVIPVTTKVNGTSLQLSDQTSQQLGGWYKPGMFSLPGPFDGLLSKLFGQFAGHSPANTNLAQISGLSGPSVGLSSGTIGVNSFAQAIADAAKNNPIANSVATQTAASSGTVTTASGNLAGSSVSSSNASAPIVTAALPSASAPASSSCLIANVQQPYKRSADLTLHNIPTGTYTMLAIWEDANGQPVQQGTTKVVVDSGKTTVAPITMQPIVKTGDISIDVVDGSTNAVNTSSSSSATPGPKAGPTKVAIVTVLPSPLAARTCVPVQIELQDAANKPVVSTSQLKITLKSSSPSGLFFKDQNCTALLKAGSNHASIAAGSSNLTTYYADSVTATPVISAELLPAGT